MTLLPALFGRDTLCAAVGACLDRPGVVTLRGPPGVGTSAVAREALAGRPHRRVSLAATDDEEAVLAALAHTLGRRNVGDPRARLDAIVDASAGLVLWLDDVRSPEGPARDLVAQLTAWGDRTVLVCAPGALGLAGEQAFVVDPMTPADAALLLEDRVHRAGGALLPADAARIVAQVGGLPLVLTLVAPQIAATDARTVLDGLRAEGLDARLLERSFARAVAALSEELRAGLVALSTLRGPFDAERAVGMIGGEGPHAVFQTLCRSSWVHPTQTGAFAMLPPVRDFARTLVRVAEEARHAHLFAAVAAPVPDDLEDLRAAWSWALRAGDASLTRLTLALDHVYVRTGPAAAHIAMLEATLPRVSGPDRRAVLLVLGRILALRGRHHRAVAIYKEAQGDTADEVSPDASMGAARLAYSLNTLGLREEAQAEAERALRCAGKDAHALASAESALGVIALSERRLADAAAAFRRADVLAHRSGMTRTAAITSANVAIIAVETQDPAAAEAAVRAAYEAAARAADQRHGVRLLWIEGELWRRQGALDRAEPLLHEAATRAGAEEDLDFELSARRGLVETAIARGDGPTAAARIEDLSALAQLSDDPSWPELIRGLRASAALAQAPEVELLLDPEARMVVLGGRSLDFGRRGPLRRVLLGLARAGGAPLTPAEVLEVGWPGERMTPASGQARVYMAIRRLRAMGFEGVLRTRDDGYALAPSCVVRWSVG